MELNFNLIMAQVLFGLALGAVYIMMASGLTQPSISFLKIFHQLIWR
jgi:hypothetical protein